MFRSSGAESISSFLALDVSWRTWTKYIQEEQYQNRTSVHIQYNHCCYFSTFGTISPLTILFFDIPLCLYLIACKIIYHTAEKALYRWLWSVIRWIKHYSFVFRLSEAESIIIFLSSNVSLRPRSNYIQE